MLAESDGESRPSFDVHRAANVTLPNSQHLKGTPRHARPALLARRRSRLLDRIIHDPKERIVLLVGNQMSKVRKIICPRDELAFAAVACEVEIPQTVPPPSPNATARPPGPHR